MTEILLVWCLLSALVAWGWSRFVGRIRKVPRLLRDLSTLSAPVEA